MPYYAGIDAGQSSTQAVIGDESGKILGRGSAGPADEVGQDASSTRLRDALAAALADAAVHAKLPSGARFTRIVAGISGYEGKVYGQPPALPADALVLEHDTVIAHAGALGAEAGVVVIAGTGSVAYAVNEAGASALVGGWGYLFGDEGSAFWLARRALSDAMRESDAGEADTLGARALQHFNITSLRNLSRTFYTGGISRAQIASFSSIVVEQAERGNAHAARFVKEGAMALARLAMHASRRVGMQAPKVALIGGMFQSKTVHGETVQSLRDLLPQASHVAPRHEPATGALLLAYTASGIPQRGVLE